VYIESHPRPLPSLRITSADFLPTGHCPLIDANYSLSFQTLTDSPTQRTHRNPFEINPFRIIYIATEGVPPTLPILVYPELRRVWFTQSTAKGTYPSLITVIQALSFHALTKCKFRNSFVLIFIQIGGGVPPHLVPQ
jgi:hypothetical protein